MENATDPKRTNVKAAFGRIRTPSALPGEVFASPGLFEFHDKVREGERTTFIAIACPGCGCVVERETKFPKFPGDESETWQLSGPPKTPTLQPGIKCDDCGWQGQLIDGTFVADQGGELCIV